MGALLIGVRGYMNIHSLWFSSCFLILRMIVKGSLQSLFHKHQEVPESLTQHVLLNMSWYAGWEIQLKLFWCKDMCSWTVISGNQSECEMPLSKCISLQTSGNCVWWELGAHSLCAELNSILGNAQREGDIGEMIGTLTQRAFMSITRNEMETTAGVCLQRVNRSAGARPSAPGPSAIHVKPSALSPPSPAIYSYPRGGHLLSQIILLGSLFCLVTAIVLGGKSQASRPPSLRPVQGTTSIILQFPTEADQRDWRTSCTVSH